MREVRVRLGAVVHVDDKILLVRHRKDGRSYWLLPGGGLEVGERVEAGLIRELAEETGYKGTFTRMLAVAETLAPDGSRHILHLIALMELQGQGIPTDRDARLDGFNWFEASQLADLDLRPAMAEYFRDGMINGWNSELSYLFPEWII